jgi:hypothetical protein
MVTRATATRGYRGEGGRPVVPVTGPASVAPALVTLRGAVGILDAQARVDATAAASPEPAACGTKARGSAQLPAA